MLAVPQLYADIEQLPEPMQIEVSHYVSFLLEKTKQNQMVTKSILKDKTEKDKSQKILALLNEISSRSNSFSGIDGVEWQKEQRQDRPLPFRD